LLRCARNDGENFLHRDPSFETPRKDARLLRMTIELLGEWEPARRLPVIFRRHCEEQGDEAIQFFLQLLDCFAALAMTECGEPQMWYVFSGGMPLKATDE
jgi:hypothetical protein